MSNKSTSSGHLELEARTYKAIVEHSSEIIFMLDKKGEITYVNLRFNNMLGRDRGVAVGKKLIAYAAKKDHSRLNSIVKDLAAGLIVNYEVDFLRSDGTAISLSVDANPFSDDGQVIGSLNFGRDITEKMRFDEERRQSGETLQALITHSPLAIIVTDLDTKVIIWNDAAEQMFGYKREEVLGKNLPTVPEEDRKLFLEMKDNLSKGGSYTGLEVRRRRKDGSIFDLSTSVAPLYGASKSVIGFIGIMEDITSRKHDEAEIKFKSQLLDNVKDSIFVVEVKDGQMAGTLYFNKAAYESRGYSFDEMKNLPISEYVAEKYRYLMKDRVKQILRDGSLIFETAHRRKDGSVIEVENHSQLMEIGERKVITGVLRDITERKHSEEELRFKSRLLDAASDSVFVHNGDKIYYANEAAYKSRGYTLNEILSLPVKKMMTPNSGEKMDTTMLEHVAVKGSIVFELEHLRKDGSSFPVEVHTRLVEYEGRELALSIAMDISTRKLGEAALMMSEARYRALFENAPVGVVLSDKEGNFLKVNEAFCLMLGYKEKEILKVNLTEISSPDDMVENLRLRKKLLAGKISSFRMEKRYIHKNGHLLWCKLSVSLVAADETFLMAHLEDITSQKKAEEALRQSEIRYRSLIDVANDAIFIADAETGILVEANKRAEKMLGLPRSEIIGKQQTMLHPHEEAERYGQIFRDAIGKGDGIVYGLYVVDSAGRLIPVEISASVIKVNDKFLMQGIFRDVTDRYRGKELSDALNNINQEIHSTLDFKEIMRRVTNEAGAVLGDSCGILLREERYWAAEFFYGSLESIIGIRFTEDEMRAATLAELTRQPVISENTATDERFNAKLVKDYKMLSVLAVPLIIKDQVVGALHFSYDKTTKAFSEAEVDFALKLAATVSLAIENARMYGSEQHIANTLQEALLKMPTDLHGIDFGYLYKSATEAAKVGGDFFDLMELEGNRLAIVIGDVSGKGLGAASLTSLLKNCIKAYAQHDRSPASIMDKTGVVILRTSEEMMFATVFLGILDLGSGELKYCCAGHPPPIVMSKNGEFKILESGSPVVGQFANLSYEDNAIFLQAEDALIAYTDGVIEARGGKKFFGEDGLLKVLAKSGSVSMNKLPGEIFRALNNFAGGVLLDDIAILAVSPKEQSNWPEAENRDAADRRKRKASRTKERRDGKQLAK